MLMAGLHFMKKVPFRTVYLHTMVTDDHGEKMSKVKGNTIDPLDVIDKYGADALRFALAWLTTSAAQGKNIKFAVSNVEDASRFANKIWNATRFALMNLEGYDPDRFADWITEGPDRAELDLPERWILSRVQRVSEEVDGALEEYRIADAAQAAYHFVWGELCDWYIELAKAGFQRAGADVEARSKIQGTLVTVLDTAMRLLHPFMPFLTEEIWQQLPKASGVPQSIMITLYPVRDVRFHDDASEASMALVQKIIVAIRSIRTERKIPSAARPPVLLAVTDDYKKTILEGYKTLIAEQGRCGEVRVRRSGSSFSGEFVLSKMARAMAGDVEVMLPLEGLVDTNSELAKLQKDKLKLDGDIAYVLRKLSDGKYLSRAPLEVIDKDKAKLAELEAALAKLLIAIDRLK
jgi:valyl-tRNA synthetase